MLIRFILQILIISLPVLAEAIAIDFSVCAAVTVPFYDSDVKADIKVRDIPGGVASYDLQYSLERVGIDLSIGAWFLNGYARFELGYMENVFQMYSTLQEFTGILSQSQIDLLDKYYQSGSSGTNPLDSVVYKHHDYGVSAAMAYGYAVLPLMDDNIYVFGGLGYGMMIHTVYNGSGSFAAYGFTAGVDVRATSVLTLSIFYKELHAKEDSKIELRSGGARGVLNAGDATNYKIIRAGAIADLSLPKLTYRHVGLGVKIVT